jgi:hypothetical protein
MLQLNVCIGETKRTAFSLFLPVMPANTSFPDRRPVKADSGLSEIASACPLRASLQTSA